MKKIFLFLTLLTLFAVTGKADDNSVSFEFSSMFSADNTQTEFKDANGIVTLTFTKTGGSSDPKYLKSGAAYRLYAGNTLTVKSTKKIKSISGEYTTSNNNLVSGYTFSPGSISETTANFIWTLNSTEGTLKNGGSSGHTKIKSICVVFDTPKEKQPLELSWTYGGQTLAADYVHEVVYENLDKNDATFDLPTLVGADGLDVTWTLSPESDDAIIDTQDGKPYIMLDEDAIGQEFTVTATVAESTEYFGDSASYKIRVISNTAPAKETIDLKWTYAGRDLEEGETITLTLPVDDEWTAHPVLVVTTEGDFTPQYSANNDNVIMVDEEGELWLLGGEAGEATVTATIPASDDYYTATRTFKLVVERAAVNLSFSAADATVDLADNTTWTNVPTLSGAPEGVTVTYTSSDPTVATVNEQGAITPLKKGTTVIKATTTADKTYAEGGATYNLTVTDSTPVVGFQLLTDINDLHYGDEIIIVSKKDNGTAQALSTTQNGNNRGQTDVTIANGVIADLSATVQILKVVATENTTRPYAFHMDKYYTSGTGGSVEHTEGGYLYAPQKSNYLKTEETLEDKGYASIELNKSTSEATIKFVTYAATAPTVTADYYLKYNSSARIFSCYTGGQTNPYIFYKPAGVVDNHKDANVKWSVSEANVYLEDQNPELPTLSKDTDAVAEYSSSNESVATINADGKVSIHGVGVTTITATCKINDNYKGGEDSYTLTVTSKYVNKKYILVNSLDELAIGDEIVIAGQKKGDGSWFALGTTQNKNNRVAVSVTVDGDVLTPSTTTQAIKLEEGLGDGYPYAFHVESESATGYLYAASEGEASGNNLLKTGDKENIASASIEIEDGVAAITFNTTHTQKYLRYNPSNAMFSCYKFYDTTGEQREQSDVYIFKKAELAEVASFAAMKEAAANISEELIDEVIFDFGKDNYLKAYGTRGEGGYTYITDSQEMVHGIRLENLPSDFDHEKDLIGLRAYYRVNQHGIAHLEYISATAYNMDFSTVVGKHFDRLDEFDPADHIHTLVTFPSVTYTNGKLVNAASPANIRGARVAAADGIKVLESEHLTAEHEGLTKSVTGIVEHDGTDYAILPTSVGEQATGIEGVEADSDVVAVIGRDILAPEGAEVYAANGARVSANGLTAGVYVVRLADGRAVKVLVK